MKFLSPYGKDVSNELRRMYRLESVAALGELVRRHLARAYGLTNVVLESAHIAYGLAVRVRADEQTYYLKFASRSMNRTPEVLFGLVNFWAAHGIPVPQVLPSVSGKLSYNLLPGSDYDVTYLMGALPGGLMLEGTHARLAAYAGLMARVHQVGSHHTPRVLGGEASRIGWRDRVGAAHTSALGLAQRTDRLQVTTCNALRASLAGTRNSLPTTDLPRTHIHGDLRLCHVLFTGGKVTGLLDIDQATWGERLVDVCYGAVSAPNPEVGAFLTFAEIRAFLTAYDIASPFTPDEKAALKGGLLAALVELLGDLVQFLDDGALSVTTEDLERAEGLFADITQAPAATLLE